MCFIFCFLVHVHKCCVWLDFNHYVIPPGVNPRVHRKLEFHPVVHFDYVATHSTYLYTLPGVMCTISCQARSYVRRTAVKATELQGMQCKLQQLV